MEKNVIIIKNNKVDYYINRKNIKNIILRVKTDGNIVLSCPYKTKKEQVENFLIKKYDWILKQKSFFKKYELEKESNTFKNNGNIYFLGRKYTLYIIADKSNSVKFEDKIVNLYIKEKYVENLDYIKRYYDKFLKEKAFIIYKELILKYQNEMKRYVKEIPNLEIKKLKSRWGSCTPKKNLVTLNLNLIKTPIECVEYVVVHELAHFKHPNHSKAFYVLVEEFIPDWKDRRKILNTKYNIVI